jgi:putative ABC transport system permease protein
MSGIYPAFVIASIYPVRALKGQLQTGGFKIRQALVVFQFGAAAALMVATITAYQQLSFMRSKDLGIQVDQVAIIKALNFDKESWSDKEGGYSIDSAYLRRAERFKEQVRAHTHFVNATALSHLPGQLPNWGTEFKAESVESGNAYRLVAMGIDYDFLSTLGVELLAGRNFSPEFPSDRGNEGKRAVMINEAAAKLLGFKIPGDAVEKHISTYWGADYEIIGVINSFHQLSLKENLQPIYFILQPRALEYFAIHYKGENASAAMTQLKSIWLRHFPDYPFNYFFLNQYFDQQYKYDEKFRDIMGSFSGLAIFVACLGLFGLTSYAIVQRTKEIGIRKVLGATVYNVIGLFTRDFVKLVLLANIIALPLVYFAITRWLENYAYKINIGWPFFVVPLILILTIALITISLQTLKVAHRNPVDSLKYD